MADRKIYVHVNQHVFRRNIKEGINEPAITVKNGKENAYTRCVRIKGPVRVEYSGNEKTLLSCGARVAITTRFGVELDAEQAGTAGSGCTSIRILRDKIRSNRIKNKMAPVIEVEGENFDPGYGAWINGDVLVRQYMNDGRLCMAIETDSDVTVDPVPPAEKIALAKTA
jgi:hypothetical protein